MKKRLCFLTLALLTVAGLSSWAQAQNVCKIGETEYPTLAEAVKAAQTNATETTTITLLSDVTDGAGIFLAAADKKNIIIDLNGKTYTAKEPAVGSSGTENQAFHLEKDNTVVIKNGTLTTTADSEKKAAFRFVIQNYANLTLEGVTVDGSNLGFADKTRYTVSNNCGTVVFKDLDESTKTNITAPAGGIAFDVCKYGNYDAPKVTWSSSGSVGGEIELTGGEFILGHNLEVNQPVRVKAAATLNLGTYTLSGSSDFSKKRRGVVIVNRDGDLTIKGTTGIIDGATNEINAAVVLTEPEACDINTENLGKSAKLTVEGGTLKGYYYGISGNGNSNRHNTVITIKGGTIQGYKSDDCVGIYHPQGGELIISGGEIKGSTGLVLKGGNLTITGGEIKGIGTAGSFVHYGSGWYNTGDALAVEVCDYPGQPLTVNINGGVFTSTNGNAVASYVQPDKGYEALTGFIHGGTFSDESAIKYAANGADINIALQANRNASGIFLGASKNVKVTFDLGSNTLNFVAPAVGSKGTENQAFHIEQGNQLFTLKNGKVTIDESAKNVYRFIIQNYNNLTVENVELDGFNLAFEGKTRYTVSNNSGTVEFKGATSIKAASENDVAFDVCKYSNYDAPTVTVNTTGTIEGRVEVTGGNLVVNSGTFSDMSGVNYVADGGTYKLANDVTISGALDINSGKKFVVDLNEKTLSGRTNIKYGDVTFVNGKINGGSNQALNVYGSEESTAENYSVLTVANNVTVTADVFGVCLFGPTASSTVGYGAVANINGTVKTTKDTSSKEGAVFVSGNLGNVESIENQAAMEGKNIVNITGSVTSASDAALALNGSATVTIAESASLTGNTAIAAKRGKLVVNGGTITGNGVCVGNPTGNGNGTELTGSALSASSTYGAHLTIDVKGGEFTSAAYTILNNSNDDDCTFNISGGSFETTKADGIAVYARLGSVNITGGTFENNSNSEATLHVGCPTVGSLQPKLTISGAPVVMNKATGNYTYNGSWSPLTVNMANGLIYKAVEISGGEFHGQSPEKDDSWTESNTGFTTFLKAGYAVKGSDNVWTVVPENASPVIAKTGDVKITDEDGENIAEVDKEQVTTTLTEATNNMTHNTEISLVYEENGLSVANDVVGDDQSVGITVELTGTKVSVTTGGETTVALKEFTFDVTPYVVTKSDKTVVSKIENDQITAPMTFRLPIPSSVTDSYARVYHKHDGKTTDLGLKEIQGTSPMRFIEISTTSFSEFAVKFTAETVTKPSTLYYYAGNPTRVDGTPENFATAKKTSANAIAFVDAEFADWASTQTNVVVIEKGAYSNSYYCPNFVLTDWVSDAVSVDFYTPVDFHVVSGYYTRDNTGNSGIKSMCLPFDLKATDITASGANFGVYHGTDMNAGSTYGNVYFNKADEVQAGTPCIVEGTEASTWNITLDGKTIKASINNTGAMKSSYAKELFNESEITQKYKVSTDGTKFTSVTASSHAWPFRAYLDLNYNNSYAPESSSIKELNIVWDDEATGIESIKSVDSNDGVVYDLTGRRVTAPVKGHLYIINGRKQLLK